VTSLSSRAAILAEIRRQLPVDAPLPSLDGPWIQYESPLAQFTDVLASVGGRGLAVESEHALRTEVDRIASSIEAQRVYSAVAAVGGNVAWESIDSPHDLADVDLAIAPGELAVAENAAVWVSDQTLPQRSSSRARRSFTTCTKRMRGWPIKLAAERSQRHSLAPFSPDPRRRPTSSSRSSSARTAPARSMFYLPKLVLTALKRASA
jgi:hypothetical protein